MARERTTEAEPAADFGFSLLPGVESQPEQPSTAQGRPAPVRPPRRHRDALDRADAGVHEPAAVDEQAARSSTPDLTDTLGEQPPLGQEPPPHSEQLTAAALLRSVPARLDPPQAGWPGRVHRWTRGVWSPAPTAAEQLHRERIRKVRRSFDRPQTIMIANPKGGAGKTPTAALLAGTFGLVRGGAVLAWDNNETAGTLGMRSAPGHRPRTVWDLLAQVVSFERVDARLSELGAYVAHQDRTRVDVLSSDEDPGRMAQIGRVEFDRLSDVLSRYYSHLVIDTGNNMRAPNWQAAAEAADVLVVCTSWRLDVAVRAAWMLDHLQGADRSDLVTRAVTVVTQDTPVAPPPEVRTQVLEHLAARTSAVVTIPYDPVIASGGLLDVTQLRPATQEAFLVAGAAVTDSLAVDQHEPNRTAVAARSL